MILVDGGRRAASRSCSSEKRWGMKIAICVCTAGVDTYGHLTRYARQFESAARQQGIATEVLLQSQPDFCQRLWTVLSDDDCIVHFYGYLYELRVGAHADAAVNAIEV